MTDPIRPGAAQPHVPAVPPTPPPSQAEGASSAGAVLELLDGVDAPRTRPAGRCVSHAESQRQRSVDRAVSTLVRGDHVSFNALTEQTRVLGALGRLTPDELESQLGAAYDRANTGIVDRLAGNYFATTRGAGRVEARVQAQFRELVRNEAIGGLDQIVRSIARTDTAVLTHALVDADPGAREQTVADALGMRGAPGDEARARSALTDIVASVRDFRDHLFGGTWEPSDFPETTNRVLCRLGMEEAPEGSILADAVEGTRPATDAGHNAVFAAEVAHAAFEVAEASAHVGVGTAAPVLIAVGGIYFGIKVHERIHENIEDRRAFAAELGL